MAVNLGHISVEYHRCVGSRTQHCNELGFPDGARGGGVEHSAADTL